MFNAEVLACPACGTEIAPLLLSCPGCRRLVHTERLKSLAAEAERAEREGDLNAALVGWREALELLPPGTRQGQVIDGRIAELGQRVDATPGLVSRPHPSDRAPGPEEGATRSSWASAAGIGALLLMVLSKAKLLLLGLTKASTFFSMFATLGLYWAAFGWWFALGFVLSIYVHEMGHVAALLRYGIKASAPLFIPGLGAVVRLQQSMNDPRQDARVGLAGPLWGLGAAVVSYVGFLASGEPVWAAVARTGAWINLLNLMPIWQLDGGRAFHAFSRPHRWLAATAIAFAWSWTNDGLLLVLLLVAGFQAAFGKPSTRPDVRSLVLYIGLVAILSAMLFIPVALRG